MEDIAGARSLLQTNSGLKDDPDTDINYGCLLYKASLKTTHKLLSLKKTVVSWDKNLKVNES